MIMLVVFVAMLNGMVEQRQDLRVFQTMELCQEAAKALARGLPIEADRVQRFECVDGVSN